jgi:hypothetical protein
MSAISPLFKKLNVGEHRTIHVLNAPASFKKELGQLDGFNIKRRVAAKDTTGFAIAFCVTQSELNVASSKFIKAANGDAVLWVAYPKGTSKKYQCEFNRDSGWAILAAADFETVRMVAIDEDWSAMRFRRVEFVRSMSRDAKRNRSDV